MNIFKRLKNSSRKMMRKSGNFDTHPFANSQNLDLWEELSGYCETILKQILKSYLFWDIFLSRFSIILLGKMYYLFTFVSLSVISPTSSWQCYSIYHVMFGQTCPVCAMCREGEIALKFQWWQGLKYCVFYLQNHLLFSKARKSRVPNEVNLVQIS